MHLRALPLFLFVAACTEDTELPELGPADNDLVVEGDLPADVDPDELAAELTPGAFTLVGDPVTGEVATVYLANDELARSAGADFTIVTPAACINCGTGCPPTSRTLRTVLRHSAGMDAEQFTVVRTGSRNFTNAVSSPSPFVRAVGTDVTIDTVGDVVSCTKSFTYTFDLTAPARAFVTSTSYKGNLGGVAGADAKCQERATAAGLGGTWHAWLGSSASGVPSSRLASDTWARVNSNLTVASSLADLSDGSIGTLINATEFGLAVSPFNKIVWTGVRSTNALAAETCNGWTNSTSSFTGRRGSTARSNGQWTDAGVSGCNTSAGLYCFEQ